MGEEERSRPLKGEGGDGGEAGGRAKSRQQAQSGAAKHHVPSPQEHHIRSPLRLAQSLATQERHAAAHLVRGQVW